MKDIKFYFFICTAIIGLQACSNPERNDRDQEATVLRDSLSDTTARAQAMTADVDIQGDDKIFILAAASGGLMEVEAAHAALQISKNKEIKAFADQMLKDHKNANDALLKIATAKGLTPPTTLNADQSIQLSDLKKLAGDAFDKQYVRMMITDHARTVQLFTEGSQLKDAELQSFAKNTLSTLQKHYMHAVELGKTFNLSNAGRGDDLQGVSPAPR